MTSAAGPGRPATLPGDRVPAPLLVLAGIVSVQFGGALAATLLPLVGAAGSVALRLAIGALIMLAVARPRWSGRSRRDWLAVTAYAAALGCMNLSFYGSLERLPIGVAVTIEFVGPLVLSAVLSRRPRDAIAVAAAGVGVVLISGALTTPWAELDLVGIALALAAGGFWALYILTSGWTGARFERLDGLTIAMCLASVVVVPLGVLSAGSSLLHPEALLKGAGIAILSSVLPYSFELLALRRLSPQVFGILLSLEPAAAALAGLIVLHQRLTPVQLVGMAMVVSASVAVLTGRKVADNEPIAEQ
ncbi:EamA family transporter [Branchiibius cervicis]|uniref:DMT family transporter n=1 Tax=Branchiibius cervicis TaxID=908252 RepID=A0ABW2ASD4_9MICO